MAPIRRGDGTELAASGYSQVRKGDGAVLWRAIPDSVIDNFNDSSDDPAGPYGSGDSLSTYYSGELSNWNRDTNDSIIGQTSLVCSASSFPFIYSSPSDGLPNEITAGDDFYFYSNEVGDVGDNGFPTFVFLADGTAFVATNDNDGVGIVVSPREVGELRIRNNGLTVNAATLSAAADTWLRTDVTTTYDSGANDLSVSAETFSVDQSTGEKQSSLALVSATVSPNRTEGDILFASGTTDDSVRFDDLSLI